MPLFLKPTLSLHTHTPPTVVIERLNMSPEEKVLFNWVARNRRDSGYVRASKDVVYTWLRLIVRHRRVLKAIASRRSRAIRKARAAYSSMANLRTKMKP